MKPDSQHWDDANSNIVCTFILVTDIQPHQAVGQVDTQEPRQQEHGSRAVHLEGLGDDVHERD